MKRIEKKSGYGDTLKRVWAIIAKYRLLLFVSLFLAAVTVVLQLYVPILFGNMIDVIARTGRVDFADLTGYAIQIALFVVIASVLTYVMNLINNKLTFQTVYDIRQSAINHIQHLPLSYLDQHSTGDIVQRVIADVDLMSDGLLLGFTQLFSGICTILITLVFMFSKNIEITLMVLLLTPASFFVSRFISSRSYNMFSKQTSIRGKQTAYINEMVGQSKVVKAFGHEAQASAQFGKLNTQLQGYTEKAIFYSSLTNPSTRAVNNVVYALVALLGAYRIVSGSLTVGGLTVLLAYASQYMKPFNDISSVITELQNTLACCQRIFGLIDQPQEREDSPQRLDFTQGRVQIEDVSFAYVKDRPFITDFNLDVSAGMTVALVGPTGCGKTTFINLLMRFYDVDGGTIRFDGQDIAQVSRKSLRENVGMVLQDTWLETGTVRDNILIGKADASDKEIIEAAKQSHSWDFIKKLPKGLDTVITDDDLSQGQKQLLCITRVMLKKPPMLILDEATSNIDTRTEVKIQSAFDKLMEGRTSFIVAHRLSTIKNADLILVMKDGHIIERGKHNELLSQHGFYETLYHSQFAKAK